jgi:Na+/pantothenate symporter
MLTVAFVVALFKMRRVATAMFSAIIALTVFSCLWNIFFKNYLSLFSAVPTALVGLLVVVVATLVLFGVIYVYLRALVREGKLT